MRRFGSPVSTPTTPSGDGNGDGSSSQPKSARTGASEPPPALILVAEDEPAVRELLVRILSTAGYAVVAAAGVGEALVLAEREGDSITLLLTDIVMPDGSGRELAERLRAARPTLPVVFCSGFSDDPRISRGELARTSAFVGKPFSTADLLQAIERQLTTS